MVPVGSDAAVEEDRAGKDDAGNTFWPSTYVGLGCALNN